MKRILVLETHKLSQRLRKNCSLIIRLVQDMKADEFGSVSLDVHDFPTLLLYPEPVDTGSC